MNWQIRWRLQCRHPHAVALVVAVAIVASWYRASRDEGRPPTVLPLVVSFVQLCQAASSIATATSVTYINIMITRSESSSRLRDYHHHRQQIRQQYSSPSLGAATTRIGMFCTCYVIGINKPNLLYEIDAGWIIHIYVYYTSMCRYLPAYLSVCLCMFLSMCVGINTCVCM